MFKRILVPLDGSPTSEVGLKTAMRMAKSGGASLLLLHVIDENVLTQTTDYGGAAYIDNLLESMRQSGKSIVARASAKATKQGIACRPVLIESLTRSVADIIVEQARKLRADVIVIGTHGRRGITRMVMGSDAEEVVRATPVPVLLIRAPVRKQS